jgi:omega-6 fatty acid desaturase (delta-12 desaturase)
LHRDPIAVRHRHDACHGALTPHGWLNKLLGRVAMLPSMHCYSVWDYGHNGLHHGYTNVRGKDQVFTPLSKEDFDRLPRYQRILQRLYRTSLGLGLYYLIEMWAHFGILQKHPVSEGRRREFFVDRLMVFIFLAVQVAAILMFSRVGAVGTNFSAGTGAWLVAVGVIIPFLFWNWTMGFVIFLHHTHPAVPWYADVEDWSFFLGQVRSVVSVELPAPIEIVLHNIMEHTAHHVDPKIPLYNLPECQRRLESVYGSEITVVKWTFRGFYDTLKRCRLFDYENHRWLDFDGTPTTEKLCERTG